MSAPKKKRWLSSLLRWGIAIAGIAYVLWNMRFHDRVRIIENGQVQDVRVWPTLEGQDPDDTNETFRVGDGMQVVPRDTLWTLPDRKAVTAPDLEHPTQMKNYKLLGVRPAAKVMPCPAAELFVQDPDTGAGSKISPDVLAEKERPVVTYPLVERGINRMAREADWWYLAAAILVLPLSYLITSYRWHVLLEAQEIHIGMARTFVINMVGAFYNSFMPGSTGGDIAKAYYASKHTTHRTRAVLTVIVDRVIGLLALLILGGVMAAFQFDIPECRKVALGAALILGATAVGMIIFYQPTLRRITGLNWFLKKLPMQGQVTHVVHAMEVYGRRPMVMLLALIVSFPVHLTAILSATLAGQAFHLGLPVLYYWVVIPVVALVGAIPISPQGAGVMEFFAVKLTVPHGVTFAQAFALVMSIRLTAIFWNLLAGIFVLRGGYHAPTEAEQHEMDEDEPEPAGPDTQPVQPVMGTLP
jgi:uncharacterized protein (TIRG00374 family)